MANRHGTPPGQSLGVLFENYLLPGLANPDVEVIYPEPTRLFEAPIVPPLPDDLDFIA